jgi:hypothetical protein
VPITGRRHALPRRAAHAGGRRVIRSAVDVAAADGDRRQRAEWERSAMQTLERTKRVPVLFPGEGGETISQDVAVTAQTTVLDLAKAARLEWPSHFVADIGGQLLTGGQRVYDAVEAESRVYLIPDQARVG